MIDVSVQNQRLLQSVAFPITLGKHLASLSHENEHFKFINSEMKSKILLQRLQYVMELLWTQSIFIFTLLLVYYILQYQTIFIDYSVYNKMLNLLLENLPTRENVVNLKTSWSQWSVHGLKCVINKKSHSSKHCNSLQQR